MKSMEELAILDLENARINEEAIAYDKIIEALEQCKQENTPIDEGVVKALIGAAAGLTMGPAIMKGVCHVLGIQENGALGNLMTSRLILTALTGYLGWKN